MKMLLLHKRISLLYRMEQVVEDFRMYMDFFNMRFRADCWKELPMDELLQKHEERCQRQLDILLYGVIEKDDEK